MGDIADMMIDGTCCECCGEFMGSEGEGFPRYCSEQCAKDRGVDYEEKNEIEVDKKKIRKLVKLFEDCNGEEICTAIAMIDIVANSLLVQMASEVLFHRIKQNVCNEHIED